MSFTPWPAGGHSLCDARRLTTKRHLWDRWESLGSDTGQHTADSGPTRDELGAKFDADFVTLLRDRRLVAHGRRAGSDVSEPIEADHWPKLVQHRLGSIDREDETNSVSFEDIRVFPALLDRSAVEIIAGKRLSVIFDEYVLNDPESAAFCDAPQMGYASACRQEAGAEQRSVVS